MFRLSFDWLCVGLFTYRSSFDHVCVCLYLDAHLTLCFVFLHLAHLISSVCLHSEPHFTGCVFIYIMKQI